MNPDSTEWLPFGFHDWLPATQAVALGLLTFVQEDVPTVSAALLASTGELPWPFGLLGVFLGIWLGDALLYLLARIAGRPLLKRSLARRFFNPGAVEKSERWFAERGTWLLLSSRFVPGTRLPTYLAAGFLRLQFGQFLLVTGLAVATWTTGIFLLARSLGPTLLTTLQRWNAGAWALLLGALACLIVIRTITKFADPKFRRRAGTALGRWTRWEFWPAWLFYLPVALNYVRLAIRHRGFTLPTAANPGIFSGGFVGESKMATLRDLQATSPEFTAEAWLLEGATSERRLESLEVVRARHRIDFPFILKPDIGQRGVGVKLIRSPEQATTCLRQCDAPLILQRYAPGPREIGVFYYRRPSESAGRIFAITEKVFPEITGDGRSTVEELIWNDARARFAATTYLKRLGGRQHEVLAPGRVLRLVEAGNHAQGCIFRDGSHLRSTELERQIDRISQRLDGFFIGRYDIRYADDDELRAGRNFQIIELNGAASEATSIYDARNSLFSAYHTLFRQWSLVFEIGAANRRLGTDPTRLSLLWRRWREASVLTATYPVAD